MSDSNDSILAEYARKVLMLEQENRAIKLVMATLLSGNPCWSVPDGTEINPSIPSLLSTHGYGEHGIVKLTRRTLVESTFFAIEDGKGNPMVFDEEHEQDARNMKEVFDKEREAKAKEPDEPKDVTGFDGKGAGA